MDTVRALMLMDADAQDRAVAAAWLQEEPRKRPATNRQSLVEHLREPVGRKAAASQALLDYLRG